MSSEYKPPNISPSENDRTKMDLKMDKSKGLTIEVLRYVFKLILIISLIGSTAKGAYTSNDNNAYTD